MPRPTALQLAHNVETENAPQSLFLARMLEEALPLVRTENWATGEGSLERLGGAVLRSFAHGGEQGYYVLGDELAHVGVYGGRAFASIAGRDEPAIAARFAELREILTPPDPSAAHEITVTFWTYGPHGPQPSWRSISVPSWDEIEQNYTGPARQPLARLMNDFRPAHGGQLILWHGEAGTGKTFALRALGWEWREWCELHYIVDPDSFFGQHADYLMNVLLQPEWGGSVVHMAGGGSFGMVAAGIEPDEVGDEHEERGWRLLVLEDTGELLTPDAKSVIGQGLARFLNLVDGLIGQGLRVLVLVTTNEEIRKLHPAVARPGRCAADIDFRPLTAEESTAWLAARGVEEPAGRGLTLASLYARAEGLGESAKESIGFGD